MEAQEVQVVRAILVGRAASHRRNDINNAGMKVLSYIFKELKEKRQLFDSIFPSVFAFYVDLLGLPPRDRRPPLLPRVPSRHHPLSQHLHPPSPVCQHLLLRFFHVESLLRGLGRQGERSHHQESEQNEVIFSTVLCDTVHL